MADETAPGSKGDAEPGAASPLSHREPPMIEGEAREIEAENKPDTDAEQPAAVLDAQDEHSAEADALPAPEAEIAAAPPPAPPAPPPPAPQRRRANPLLFLVAMILGAAIALGGAYGLHVYEEQSAAVTPNPPDEKLAALAARVDAVDAASASTRASLAALDKRVAASEAAARAAQAKAEAAAADAQKALSAPPATSPVPPFVTAENPTPTAAPAAAPVAAPAVDLGPLEAKLAELGTRVAANEEALKAPKSENRADRTPPPPPPAASPQANGAAIAIVAASLNGKLMRGAPFAQELATLDALGADKAGLAPLRPLADKGVATERQLVGEFQALADRIRATDVKDDGSYIDRLAQHAANLVRVRRLDAGPGKDVESLVSRIESRLAQNDLPGALAAWNELPPAAKNLSAAWADTAKTRLDALAAARGVEETAIVTLGKAKS